MLGSAVVCSSTGHDIFSRPRCFLPKRPKTDKIYLVNTLEDVGLFSCSQFLIYVEYILDIEAAAFQIMLLFRGYDIRVRIAFRRRVKNVKNIVRNTHSVH